MDTPQITGPEETTIIATSIGAVLAILMTPRSKLDWQLSATTFIAGEALGWWGTPAVAGWLGWGAERYGLVGVTLGFGALYVFAGVLAILARWRDNPFGFVRKLMSDRFSGDK